MSNTFSMLKFGQTLSICAYQWAGGGREGRRGLLIIIILAEGGGGGGVNAKRDGLQILDLQRLASLLGNLGILVRIHTQT